MLARIYQPARNAMQSGMAKTRQWIMEFEQATPRELEPLMGWTATDDMTSEVRIRFDSEQAAVEFAKTHNIPYQVARTHKRKPNIRPGGYGENFAANRKTVWTH